jgi:long-chain acyl-CoA synthetase
MEKIWLKSYPPGVDENIADIRDANLADFYRRCCKQFKNASALSHFDHEISYGRLLNLSLRMAAYLQKQFDIKPGDNVALILPNCMQFQIMMLAIHFCGATAVNINPEYTECELEFVLSDSQVKAVIILDLFASKLKSIQEKLGISYLMQTSIVDCLPFVKRHMVGAVIKYIFKKKSTKSIAFKHNFKVAIRRYSVGVFKSVAIDDSAIAFLQYTGGTTGKPKAAMLSHRNMLANVAQISQWFGETLKPGKEIALVALPLYHIFSLTVNCMLQMSLGAKAILITDPRDFKHFFKQLHKHKFTVFAGVNTLFNRMIHYSGMSDVDFSFLKVTVGGGMAVQEHVAKAWKEKTGSPLLEGYGLTEASPVVCMNPLSNQQYNGSIGLPLPATDVKFLDDALNELKVGEVGQLAVKGEQVMTGYWHQDEETKNVMTSDGYLLTGDIACMDDNGFIYLKERKKDLIIVSGFNVYPAEVEAVLVEHDAIYEAGVVGINKSEVGEVVIAFIVLEDVVDTRPSDDVLKQWCREKLAAYKVPKSFHVIEQLPKTSVGKILRKDLRGLV